MFVFLASTCTTPPPPACDPGSRFDGIPPIASGDGPIRTLHAAGDLTSGGTLFVRVTFDGGRVPDHQIYIDVDGSRFTGMWTLQSPISAAGWNLLVEDGRLHTHDGNPSEWSWQRREPEGYGVSTSSGVIDVCIPVSALADAPPRSVRLAVLTGEVWLPDMFLPGAAYPRRPEPAVERADEPPGRLGFHYGATPWVVRDCTDVACAAEVYGRLDHIVFGSGLEDASHSSHETSVELIRAIRQRHPATEVWGYVSLVGSAVIDDRRDTVYEVADITARARAWRDMGATGVFLDEGDLCLPEWGRRCHTDASGEDIPITRARQSAVISSIHELGLPVFANAFAPLDILAGVDGVPSLLGGADAGRPADMYLLENPVVGSGGVRTGIDAAAADAKFRFALQARAELGVRVAVVDTGAGEVSDDASEPGYATAYARALREGVDAFGFTNATYSAAPELAANLPLQPRPS